MPQKLARTSRTELRCGPSGHALKFSWAIALAAAPEHAIASGSAISEPAAHDEIVVTAQKREQSLRDVPLSVSVISTSDLETRSVAVASDLVGIVPGLQVARGADSQTVNYAIRGITTALIDFGVSPSVGVYIDGVYVDGRAASDLELVDVERVEVLRGPQGTLFGRNATAGAISIVSRRPGTSTEGSLLVDADSLERQRLRVSFGGPIGNSPFYFRAGAVYSNNNGWITNTFDNSKLNSGVSIATRATVGFDAGGAFTADLNLDWTSDDSRPAPAQLLPLRRQLSLNTPMRDDREARGANLTLRQDLGPVSLESITAYRKATQHTSLDNDLTANDSGRPSDLSEYLLTDVTQDSWSQELRLSNTESGKFNWILGAFYYDYDIDVTTIAQERPLYVPITGRSRYSVKEYAAFGQGDLLLSDRLTVTLGGRYSKSDFRARLDLDAIPPFVPKTNFDGTESDDSFTYKAALSYRTEPATIYASVSTGYKPGGINTAPLPTSLETFRRYKGEYITNYEAGIKAVALDSRLRLNAAAFYMDYKNQQVLTSTISGFSSNNFIANADKSTSRGVEIEGSFQASKRVTFTVTGSFLDARYDTFAGCGTSGQGPSLQLIDCIGNKAILAPKLSGSTRIEYRLPLGGDKTLMLAGDVTYASNMQYDVVNSDAGRRPPLTLVNLDATLIGKPGRWSVTLYGRNVFDRQYFTYWRLRPAGDTYFLADPATVGLRASVQF